MISASSTTEVEAMGTSSVTGGVVDAELVSTGSLMGAFSDSIVPSIPIVSESVGVIIASVSTVASDERVVKTGIGVGVWNKPTRDRGPSSSIGKPEANTGERPVGGVWKISTGDKGVGMEGDPTIVGKGLYLEKPCRPRANEGVGIRGGLA